MGRLDNEENIIKDMHEVTSDQIMLLPGSKFEKQLISAIMKEWPKWTANNGHACEPPDYFSRDHRLMFDVMRVNDSETSIITKRGKEVRDNPVLKREQNLAREAKKFFPNVSEDNIFVNAVPDGDYDKIHNYQNYYKHAQKVFSSHIKRIPRCRELHPGYKMGFLVMDETESYLQHSNIMDAMAPYDPNKVYKVLATPHLPFTDRRFMQCLFESDLDFLIWFMPYKHNEKMKVQPPVLCFIDLTDDNAQEYLRNYPQYLMRRM